MCGGFGFLFFTTTSPCRGTAAAAADADKTCLVMGHGGFTAENVTRLIKINCDITAEAAKAWRRRRRWGGGQTVPKSW